MEFIKLVLAIFGGVIVLWILLDRIDHFITYRRINKK